jgi:hypothetical protein
MAGHLAKVIQSRPLCSARPSSSALLLRSLRSLRH